MKSVIIHLPMRAALVASVVLALAVCGGAAAARTGGPQEFTPPADVAPPVFGNVNFLPAKALGNATRPQARSITRAEVLARARVWVKESIPYCQCNGPEECCGHCPFCGTYRCDCSGYVSHCWNAGHGYTTRSMHEVAHPISKDDLKPGDAMLNAGVHVVLFAGWVDNTTKKEYHCFQEPGCHNNGPHHAYESIVPYPFTFEPS
jgi:hypothetical protein